MFPTPMLSTSTNTSMQITFRDRHATLHAKLQDKLGKVAELRCDDHEQPVVAVVIDALENGWFDSRWTTCCQNLAGHAATILGNRC
jgi:hypothetical protein